MSEKISVAAELDLPYGIDRVWPLLSDFANYPKQVAGAGPVTITGSGIGMVRRVPFETRWSDERLDEMDHDNHRFVYSITAASEDVDFHDYESEISLMPLTENSCRYRREGRFRVNPGVDEQSVRDYLGRAYRISMNSFAEALQRRFGG